MSQSPSQTVRGLLDTSVVIALQHVSSEHLPEEPAISALTPAELAAGPLATDDERERARRQDRLQRVEALLDPLPFDAPAARAYGRVYAATKAAERRPRGARAIDLMIAAVALANGLPLFTRNPGDFEHLRDIGHDLRTVPEASWRMRPKRGTEAVRDGSWAYRRAQRWLVAAITGGVVRDEAAGSQKEERHGVLRPVGGTGTDRRDHGLPLAALDRRQATMAGGLTGLDTTLLLPNG